LHSNFCFKHEQRLLWHFPLQLQLQRTKPWADPLVMAAAYYHTPYQSLLWMFLFFLQILHRAKYMSMISRVILQYLFFKIISITRFRLWPVWTCACMATA
jgi:hypothetical protein